MIGGLSVAWGDSRLDKLFIAVDPVTDVGDRFGEEDVEGWVEDEAFGGREEGREGVKMFGLAYGVLVRDGWDGGVGIVGYGAPE